MRGASVYQEAYTQSITSMKRRRVALPRALWMRQGIYPSRYPAAIPLSGRHPAIGLPSYPAIRL